MNKGWYAVLASVVLSAGVALASERLDEMTEQIEAQVEDTNDQELLNDAVEEYIQERDATFTVLTNLTEVNTEDDMQSEWESAVDDLSDMPGLYEISSSLTSDAAKTLYDQFMDEEQEWVSALSVLNTASYRNEIVALRIRLATMTELLEEKWEGFLNEDGQLDEKELKIMADINTIATTLAGQSDTSRQSLRNAAQIIAEMADNADDAIMTLPGPIGELVKIAAQTAKTYNEYKTALEALKPQLKDLMGKELGILVIFNQTRKDTQLFVEQNNFDKMKALYGEAEDELESFVDVGTDGQRSDAEDFVEVILESLSKHVSDGETIFKAFVTKHERKFYGPLGPDITESFIESQVWLAEAGEVRNLDLEESLSAFRDESNVFFGVNLSVDGITDVEREFITSQIKSDLEALRKAIDDNMFVFSNDNLSLIYDRRSLVDTLK